MDDYKKTGYTLSRNITALMRKRRSRSFVMPTITVIILFDTAIPEEYGDAEEKLGQFAKTIDRNTIIISDKARFYSGGEIYREVLRSTETLRTRPDIYFVHQVDESNADEVFGKYGAVDALYDLKREGRIGFTGIASHYYNVLYRAALDPCIDVLQGIGNILERGMLDRIRQEQIERVHQLLDAYGGGCFRNA